MKRKYSKEVPEKIKRKTAYFQRKYFLSLADAFDSAVREEIGITIGHTDELYFAFMEEDYRAFIPQEYEEKYLDYEKYPLHYKKFLMTGKSNV